MTRRIISILLFIILIIGYAYAQTAASLQLSGIADLEPITKKDRILILAPHPDDETIGCASIIQEAVNVGAEIQVVYFTNGDHNQVAFIVYEKRLTLRKGEFIHMGEVRRREAIKAMKLLGLNEENLIFLGYPDFGTFTIFRDFWQTNKPFKGILTRISRVPYKENLSYNAPYTGESILSDLKFVLKKYKPNKIFVSHPADTNVDHKALYLFLQISLADLDKELPQPKIYPYLIHCVGWPLPRHYHPELALLPPQQFLDSQVQWFKRELSPGQLNKKYRAIFCYQSQTSSSAFYLLSFARKNELFGDYPSVELTLSPPTLKEKQISFKNKLVAFFGISNIFTDTGMGANGQEANPVADKGQVSYGLMDDSLLIRVGKTEKLNGKFNMMIHLFGYSYKTPFAQMPKIRIITKYNRFKVFDARKMIKAEDIESQLNPKDLILKVPLKILGEPDFVLASVKSYAGVLPVNTVSFRKINIRR